MKLPLLQAEALPSQQPVFLVDRLRLEEQIGPIGVVYDVHNRLRPGESLQIHRLALHTGPHPNRGSVDNHLRAGVAAQVVVIVRAAAGDDHYLPGLLLNCGGTGRQRRSPAAQDDHLFVRQRDARPAEHIQKTVNVGVIAVQLSLPANQGVHAADCLRRRVDNVAEGHYLPLIGDGDVQPADVLPLEAPSSSGSSSIRR